MRTRKAACYVSLVLALAGLSWFLLHRSRVPEATEGFNRSPRSTGSPSEGSSSEDPPHLATNAGPRDKAPAAGPIRKEEFRRFFLPPLRFEDATLEQAIAKLTDAYRQVAIATGSEFPADLHIDLSSARSDQRLTCTTPRATVPMVLHFIAAQAGNAIIGELPEFRLTALDETPNQSGSLAIPSDALSLLLRLQEAQKLREQGPDPFAPAENSSPGNLKLPSLAAESADPFAPSPAPYNKISVQDLLASFGISSSKDSALTYNGESISYQNLSQADIAKLQSIFEVGQGSDFTGNLMNLKFTVLSGPEAIAPTDGNGSLSEADYNAFLRNTAQTSGTNLRNLPEIAARFDVPATAEMNRESPSADGTIAWTGFRITTTGGPVGLGNEITVHYESRNEGEDLVTIDGTITIPKGGSGLSTMHTSDGRVIAFAIQPRLIDMSGSSSESSHE